MNRLIEEARQLLTTRSLAELTNSDLSAIDTALAAGQVAAKDLAAARLREEALQAEVDKLRVAIEYRYSSLSLCASSIMATPRESQQTHVKPWKAVSNGRH